MVKWVDRLMKVVDVLSEKTPEDPWTAFWMAVFMGFLAGLAFSDGGWRDAWPVGYELAWFTAALVVLWFDNLRGDQRHRTSYLMIGLLAIFYSSWSFTMFGNFAQPSAHGGRSLGLWAIWIFNSMGIPFGTMIVAHTLVHWRDPPEPGVENGEES